MNNVHKIIYWVATVWLSVAMTASAVQQIFTKGGFVEIMQRLEFPIYFSVIIGLWKIGGVIALLIPRFPLLKEWAYGGFFFLLSGAIFSHLAMKDAVAELFAPLCLLVMTIISWYYRPIDRRISNNY